MVAFCPTKQLGAALLFLCTAQNLLAQGLSIHSPGDTRPLLTLESGPSDGTEVDDASGSFSITVNFGGGLTSAQEALFTDAAAVWESHLIGYHDSIVNAPTGITITASGAGIDGPNGTLAQAGPTTGMIRSWDRGYDVFLATGGQMTFDTADIGSMSLTALGNVILHEMGHVIGLGTLWNTEALGFAGTQALVVAGSGQYTGTSGLAQWQMEFSPGATHVPVELSGGAGTADAHWNEVNGGGSLTGITDADGNDMRNELMTGWLDSPTFISDTTIASFEDLGFVVSLPEPSQPLLLAFAMLLSGLHRRR